jgi:serine/threonine protein kinase
LLDRYKIEALVGLGGMGAVYCAFHEGIERRVAFKILQPNIALADERLVELFEREAKVAGRLTHENIVDVKDAGRVTDSVGGHLAYIVMEWLEGRTLEDELRNVAHLSLPQTYEILRQMSAALAEAHGKNVVHRDLKPANVMLTQRGDGKLVVKVLDFGIGKIVNETGASVSAVMGTPSYASPEQLQLGGKIDPRSDIYSLGVMLYRMLAGRLPFTSTALTDLIQMQLQETPPALRVLRPDIPPALETLIHQMMAKDATQRPQSVQEVTERFAHALEGLVGAETAGINWTPAPAHHAASAASALPVNSRKTELMSDAPTPRRFEVAAQSSGAMPPTAATAVHAPPRRSLLVPGALLGVALAGGGFALYRYAFDAGASQRGQVAQAQPTPVVLATTTPLSLSATPVEITPHINVAPKAKPSVKAAATPAAVATSTPPPATPENKSSLPLVTSKPATDNPPPPANNTASNEATRWPVADSLYQQALRQYEAGNYKAALNLCNQALRIRPLHPGARQLKQKLQSGMRILNNPR